MLAVALAGCGDEGGSPTGTFAMPDDSEVVLDADGAVRLREGGRDLFTMPGGTSITLRTFDEEASGSLAIWSFDRTDEAVVPLRRGAAREEGGEVVVDYDGANGVEGSLTVRPADGFEGTRLRFEWTGLAADSVAVPVRCDEDGSFHGFGEQYNATEQTGEAFTLMVTEQGIGRDGGLRALQGDAHTTYFPMPYYLDVRGHGALFLTDHRVE
ncbi:MAG: hypothetical protein ACOC9T_03580, partial [Myxococcota bacterium]